MGHDSWTFDLCCKLLSHIKFWTVQLWTFHRPWKRLIWTFACKLQSNQEFRNSIWKRFFLDHVGLVSWWHFAEIQNRIDLSLIQVFIHDHFSSTPAQSFNSWFSTRKCKIESYQMILNQIESLWIRILLKMLRLGFQLYDTEFYTE